MPNRARYTISISIGAMLLFLLGACGDSDRLYRDFDAKTYLKRTSTTQYSVKDGDNLYLIAQTYNIDLRALIRANGLQPPYSLRNGQILNIPQALYHIVQSGESLSVIAHRYETRARTLILLNKLQEPYIIRPGQKIFIPDDIHTKATELAKPPQQTIQPTPQLTETDFIRAPLPPELAARYPPFVDNGATFLAPMNSQIISRFGKQGRGIYNDGINFSAEEGDIVRSAADGEVVYSDNQLRQLGNLILLRHDGGFMTAYAHNSENLVRLGQKIKRGQVIAKAGSSGYVKRPQLHFQLRQGNKILNPEKYIKNI